MKNPFIVYQAKSFYNAYICLDQIHRSSQEMMLSVPMLVYGAFSVELTIKAILANNDIKYGKEHNLAVLFDLLPMDIQNKIWDWVAKKTPEYSDDQKRREELFLMSGAFEKWRYYFEESAPAFDSRFLASFANASIGVMFSLGLNVDLVPIETEKSDSEIEAKFSENRIKHIAKNTEYIQKKKGSSKQ